MLKLSERAAEAIKSMLKDADAEGAALRIGAEMDEEGTPGLHISFVGEPEDGDEEIEEQGITIYLDASAADALDDKILDAEPHGDHVHFGIEDQVSS
jgi:iron-sulfur cluster assembly protein